MGTLSVVLNLNALVLLLGNGGVVGGMGLATIDSNFLNVLAALSTEVNDDDDGDGEKNGDADDDRNDHYNIVITIIDDG